MRPRLLALVTVAVVAMACGGPDQAPPTAQQTDMSGPLDAFPPCPAPPSGTAEEVQGLIVPDGTVVTQVTPQEPLVTVSAYVDKTPVQFEDAYTAMDGVTILQSENEVFEAELLISNGTHRNFLKATAQCRTGSQLIIVVAPELDAEGLPTPQGATPTAIPTD